MPASRSPRQRMCLRQRSDSSPQVSPRSTRWIRPAATRGRTRSGCVIPTARRGRSSPRTRTSRTPHTTRSRAAAAATGPAAPARPRARSRSAAHEPGTGMSDEIQLNDPQTLYRRWEDSQWSPFMIDLSRDQEQWPQLHEHQRGLISFALSSLMVAEERITTKFSGLVGAHGSEEEATFLSTQQVDEARHMQFYARFQDQVVADPATISDHVERAREQVSESFRQIFDVALVEAHEELVAAPGDLGAKVRFITIYHLILESTLGLTSFKFITDHLKQNELLPGFVEGYSYIHHDETRHIGYGVWFLREAVKAQPDQADTVRQTLRDLLPAVADSLKPPGEGTTALGVTDDDVRNFALQGLTRRLSIIGVPLESVYA